jgi:hypothetical protein
MMAQYESSDDLVNRDGDVDSDVVLPCLVNRDIVYYI